MAVLAVDQNDLGAAMRALIRTLMYPGQRDLSAAQRSRADGMTQQTASAMRLAAVDEAEDLVKGQFYVWQLHANGEVSAYGGPYKDLGTTQTKIPSGWGKRVAAGLYMGMSTREGVQLYEPDGTPGRLVAQRQVNASLPEATVDLGEAQLSGNEVRSLLYGVMGTKRTAGGHEVQYLGESAAGHRVAVNGRPHTITRVQADEVLSEADDKKLRSAAKKMAAKSGGDEEVFYKNMLKFVNRSKGNKS